MKISVWNTRKDARPIEYNNVITIVTEKACKFMDAEELAGYGVKAQSMWTRLYMEDGNTATFDADGLQIVFLK